MNPVHVCSESVTSSEVIITAGEEEEVRRREMSAQGGGRGWMDERRTFWFKSPLFVSSVKPEVNVKVLLIH